MKTATPSRANPYKLVYNTGTDSISFIPQTAADRRATKALTDRLNAFIADTSSQSAVQAKSTSDALKAEINRLATLRNLK